MNFRNNTEGSLTEYGILLGLIAILSIISLQTIGIEVDNLYTRTANTLEAQVIGSRFCNIENGSGTQSFELDQWQSCVPTSCETGFHIEDISCILNTSSNSVDNGEETLVWDEEAQEWVVEDVTCNNGFHEEGGNCISNTRIVNIPNGTQTQIWFIDQWQVASVNCGSGYERSGTSCIKRWSGTWSFIKQYAWNPGYTEIGSASGRCYNEGQTAQTSYWVGGDVSQTMWSVYKCR